MFAELTFKAHGLRVPDDLSLYEKVPENIATGRTEKSLFTELQVHI